MGAWTISGPGINMIENSAFGVERGRLSPGMVTAQTITFDGYGDFSGGTTSVQALLQTYLSSGTPIYSSSKPAKHVGVANVSRLKLWANDDATLPGYGYWAQSSAASSSVTTVKTYITGLEVGQNMDGVQTISFTAAVTGGAMTFSTSST